MSSALKYPQLAQPVKLGALTANNRTLMASMTRSRAVPSTLPNELVKEYYVQRSGPSGAGLILTEGIYISPQGGEYANAPGIWDEEHALAWKSVVDGVHAAGTQIVAQLWHIGRIANNDSPLQKKWGEPVYGPSAVGARGGKYRRLPGEPGHSVPVAIPDPEVILDQYEHAARMAKIAGFDGVEVHGANGYLVAQFLSDVANVRTDSWGGSVENRARFALESVQRLVKVWGADRVGIKLSPSGGFNDLGFSSLEANKEQYHYLVQKLDQMDLAYIQIIHSNPMADTQHVGLFYNVVDEYRPSVKNTPLVANQSYTADSAEELVKAGKADAVAFGKNFLANPDWHRRIQIGADVNTITDFFTLYNIKDGNPAIGYTDFPSLPPAEKINAELEKPAARAETVITAAVAV